MRFRGGLRMPCMAAALHKGEADNRGVQRPEAAAALAPKGDGSLKEEPGVSVSMRHHAGLRRLGTSHGPSGAWATKQAGDHRAWIAQSAFARGAPTPGRGRTFGAGRLRGACQRHARAIRACFGTNDDR